MSRQEQARRPLSLWWVAGVLLVLGLIGGLVLSWEFWPVEYLEAHPADLRTELKQDYLSLIGSSFALNEDFDQAHRRLGWLGLSDGQAVNALGELIEQKVRSGADVGVVRGLSKLAYALGARDSQILVFIVTPTPTVTPIPTATPTISATMTATPTPSPVVRTVVALPAEWETARSTLTPTETATKVPTETPVLRYELVSKQFSCRPFSARSEGQGILQVRVWDEMNSPLVGVPINVSWGNDQDEFFTGLKPEKGLDYADFQMQPGWEYSLNVDHDASQPVKISFRDKDCITNTLTTTVPTWEVVFRRRSPGKPEKGAND